MHTYIYNVFIQYKNMPLPLKVSFWYFVCMLVSKGVALITTPLFTRILSTGDYGMVSVYNSWQSIIGIFVTFGLSNSVFNVGLVKFDKDKNNFNSAMIGLLLLSLVVSSFIIMVTYDALRQLFQLDSKYIIAMLLTSFFSCLQSMWLLRKRMEYDYRWMTILTLSSSFLQVILSILLVMYASDKAFAKVMGASIVIGLIGVYCFINIVRNNYHLFDKKYWLFALKYNFPMLPHFLAGIILNQVDRVMIQKMVGLNEAGIYTVAYNGAMVIYIINNALYASYNPWLLKRLQAKRYDKIDKIVNYIMLIYLLPLLFLILFAPEVIKVLAPMEYYEGVYVIPPVACSMFFILLFNMFAPVEHFSLKTKFLGGASIVAAIANIVLNYVFIRSCGYLAAGYTTLACYILYAFAHWCYMKKSCKQIMGNNIFNDKVILLLSLGVVIISLLSTFFYQYPIVRYCLLIAVILLAAFKFRSIKKILYEIKK